MNTSILTLALSSVLLAPSWQTSYTQAQKNAVASQKPLVVIFGSGADGWTKVIRDDKPAPAVSKLLSDHYVYVYVDVNGSEGKRLAQNFEITKATGMVISDRKGTLQAFWHEGDLTNDNAVRFLQKYADPNVAVQGTETISTPRISYYQGGYPQGATQGRAISSANC